MARQGRLKAKGKRNSCRKKAQKAQNSKNAFEQKVTEETELIRKKK
jgi:hypothetical protein